MRARWRAACLAALLIPCSQAARAFENEPTGFRGVAWGTPISQAQGVYLHDHAVGDRVSYRRAFEDLSVNGIPLTALYYDFFRARFEQAILVSRRDTGNDLLRTFAARYGTPSQIKGHRNQYFWAGAISSIVLTCSGRYLTCTAIIASNAMQAEDNAGETDTARKADKDF
jgi:hypothetical protein